MQLPTKIFLFLLCNVIGFYSMSVCYYLGVKTGSIDLANSNPAAVHRILSIIMMTWFVCGLFSLSWFFLKGREKYFFLLAPVVFPFLYGFSVIFDLF